MNNPSLSQPEITCSHCQAGEELCYNEPGGLRDHASYWHLTADSNGNKVLEDECPLWRDHEIEKLNKDFAEILRQRNAAFACQAVLAHALEPFVRYIEKRLAVFGPNSVNAYPELLLSGTKETAQLEKVDWDQAVQALGK